MNQNVNNIKSVDKHLKHAELDSRNTKLAHSEKLNNTDKKVSKMANRVDSMENKMLRLDANYDKL